MCSGLIPTETFPFWASLMESVILVPKQFKLPFSSYSPFRIFILGLPTNSATLIVEGLL